MDLADVMSTPAWLHEQLMAAHNEQWLREEGKILGIVEYEAVQHPKHYNSHPAGIECIEVIQHMTFNIGTAVKHLWRHGLKPGADAIEDINKAIQYLEFEKERLRAGQPVS